jgi:acyl-CoA reductase-like NAD-dependent aldehyde dehydrogenase
MVQGVEIEIDHLRGVNYILDTNPADGSLIEKVICSSKEEIDIKIQNLKMQQTKWRLVPLEERVQILRDAIDHLLAVDEQHTLATLISQEMGKVLPESRGELEKACTHFSGALLTLMKEANEPQAFDNACIVRDPLGIVAILSPWNFPVLEILKHLLPALTAGNAVILKPSEVVPLVGQYVVSKLLQYSTLRDVALPLDLVQGDGIVGEILARHKDIDAVCMTGSSATGKKVMESCGRTLKRVILELGGKDPMIVFQDADLQLAAKNAVIWSTYNAGQVCASVERIYVDRCIKKQFEELCVHECEKVKAGSFNNPASTMGPMVSWLQKTHVDAQVCDAVLHGAHILYKGEVLEVPQFENGVGCYYPATVLADLTHDMAITKEETFGPVVAIYEFDGSEEQAIELANNTNYGLTASVYSQDLKKCQRVSLQIRAGQVGINTFSVVEAPMKCPFVGHKESGIGYHSGMDGYRQYSVPKSIVLSKQVATTSSTSA